MFFRPVVNLVQPHQSATPPHYTKKIEVAQLVQVLSVSSKTIFRGGVLVLLLNPVQRDYEPGNS